MPVLNPGQPLSAPIPFPGVERAPEPPTPPPAPKPAPPAPNPVAAPVPKPTPPPVPAPLVPSGPVVSIPLAAVFAGWPEPIKDALSSLNFAQAKLEIACADLEPQVKRGRITLTWGTVRGLIRPAVPAEAAQDLSAQELELPLPAVVPLFLQKQKPSAPVRKTVVPTDLPELFKPSGAPAAKPAVETAPVAAPVAAPVPVAPKPVVPTPAPAPAPVVKKVLTIGDILGNPKQTDWPLNDVVMGGCNLPGVAGMVVATDDGMLVAGQLGEGLVSDQFAAVIPAAFTRLEPLSEALQKPKPAQLVFQLDNTPLAMFRAGTLFLAVLGRPGGTLPMDSLTVVAAYLEKQSS